MLRLIPSSSNKKLGPCASTYRAGQYGVYSTCPNSCPLKPDSPSTTGSDEIDLEYLDALLKAVPNGGVSWTYTHFPSEKLPPPNPLQTTLNVSTDTVDQALSEFSKGFPVVCVRPSNESSKVDTYQGVRFIRCPAEYQDKVTCRSCGGGKPLCARQDRDYVIKFTGHGSSAKKISLRDSNPELKGGCYGSSGPVHLQWKRTVSSHQSDSDLLLSFARSLPRGTFLRHHVVGDLGVS